MRQPVNIPCGAVHESAHAILVMRGRGTVQEIVYSAQGECVCRSTNVPSLDAIMSSLAGPISEVVFGYTEKFRPDATDCRDALRMYAERCRRLPTPSLRELISFTEKYLRQNAQQILRLAGALTDHGRLSGSEIWEIIEVGRKTDSARKK